VTLLIDTDPAARAERSRVVAAGGVALVAAGLAGWSLGGVWGAPQTVAAPAPAVVIGDMRFGLPAGWAPAPEGGQAFVPAPGLPARALLVSGPAVDRSLIPASLRESLPADLPDPRRTELGGLPAWAYGPLRGEGRTLEVTVAPTSTGMLAVACSAPPDAWVAALGCADRVRGIALGAGRALTPTAELGFRQRSRVVVGDLDARRVRGRRSLARAAGPRSRAAAARRLAAAHRGAANRLAPLAAGGASADAVGALRRAERGYARLAVAARHGARRRFANARAAIRAADADLVRALQRLRR
jgi:hypothetical protein